LTTFTQRARELAGLNERQPFELAWVCLLAENANPALYLGYKSELFTALAILFWFSVRAIRDRASSPNTAIQRSHAPVLLLSLVTLLLVGPVARIAAPSQTTPFDFTGSVLILTTIILMRFVTIRAPTAADIMRRGKSRSQAR
jgi:hypothetical protein